MIQTVINKFKYVIGSFVILIGIIIVIFINGNKKNIYILYEKTTLDCYNEKKQKDNLFFVFCDGEKRFFLEKIKSKNSKEIKDIKSLNFISKEELFDKFYSKINNKVNFFIIKKTKTNKYKIIPVNIFQSIS